MPHADRPLLEGGKTPMSKPTLKRVLYLDLDGTVRWGKDELGRFVNGPNDVRVFDEVPKLLAHYRRQGWRIIGISNQGGVALGIMTMEQCSAAMLETHKQAGEAFDKISFCTHHPDAKDRELAVCWCRKPRVGLVITAALELAAQHNEYYPPHLSLFVGDRPEDQECAAGGNIPFKWAADWRAEATELLAVPLTITCKYTCRSCGLQRVEVQVPARGDQDNPVHYLEQVVAMHISADHRRRSPRCASRKMDELMIPMPEGSERIGEPSRQ